MHLVARLSVALSEVTLCVRAEQQTVWEQNKKISQVCGPAKRRWKKTSCQISRRSWETQLFLAKLNTKPAPAFLSTDFHFPLFKRGGRGGGGEREKERERDRDRETETERDRQAETETEREEQDPPSSRPTPLHNSETVRNETRTKEELALLAALRLAA